MCRAPVPRAPKNRRPERIPQDHQVSSSLSSQVAEWQRVHTFLSVRGLCILPDSDRGWEHFPAPPAAVHPRSAQTKDSGVQLATPPSPAGTPGADPEIDHHGSSWSGVTAQAASEPLPINSLPSDCSGGGLIIVGHSAALHYMHPADDPEELFAQHGTLEEVLAVHGTLDEGQAAPLHASDGAAGLQAAPGPAPGPGPADVCTRPHTPRKAEQDQQPRAAPESDQDAAAMAVRL